LAQAFETLLGARRRLSSTAPGYSRREIIDALRKSKVAQSD
jgi:hypothetical protein